MPPTSATSSSAPAAPFTRGTHADLPAILLGLVALGICYGSWIPFNFDPSRLPMLLEHRLPPLGLPRFDLEDALVNVLIYLPVGILISLRRGRVVAVAIALSVLAETVQGLLPARSPSWIDVALNVSGAVLGFRLGPWIAGAAARILGAARKTVADRPMSALASATTVLWAALALSPFDFVPNTAELHDRFLSARWSLLPDVPSSPVKAFEIIALWAPLMIAAACLSLDRRSQGWSRGSAFLSGVRHAVVVGTIVEVLQIFSLDRRFELSGVVWALLAGIWGSGTALMSEGLVKAPARAALRLNRAFLPTAALLGTAYLAVLPSLVFGDAGTGSGFRDGLPVVSAPFERLWSLSVVHAAGEAAGMLARGGLVALLLMAVIGGRRASRHPLLTSAAAAMCVLLLPGTGATTGGAIDLTGPMLALSSGVAMILGYQVVRPQAARAS
ncbi:MAG: hypothetical protein FLDDKLPJ_03272 [Phycisphaerae bacterium]|nr:hypothetical protein [Phycisphaerae bacterium]